MRALFLLTAVFALAIIALYWNDQAKPGRWDEEENELSLRKVQNPRSTGRRKGHAA